MQYLLLQQHLQQQQVQAAIKMGQVGVQDSNLANSGASNLKFGSQIDGRQFTLSNPLALYQQQLQQHMQLQAQQQQAQQQQHKDTETAAEKQHRLVLLQHQQFLVQQRMMHAHLMQQSVRRPLFYVFHRAVIRSISLTPLASNMSKHVDKIVTHADVGSAARTTAATAARCSGSGDALEHRRKTGSQDYQHCGTVFYHWCLAPGHVEIIICFDVDISYFTGKPKQMR